ncbi:MAG: hypothetical protein AAFV33_11540 [Chloroflexota bacterium]
MSIINRGDKDSRLRFLRYGLIVSVVMTFVVALAVRWGTFARLPNMPDITFASHLMFAIVTTIVVAVIAVAIYFGYSFLLGRMGVESESASAAAATE